MQRAGEFPIKRCVLSYVVQVRINSERVMLHVYKIIKFATLSLERKEKYFFIIETYYKTCV